MAQQNLVLAWGGVPAAQRFVIVAQILRGQSELYLLFLAGFQLDLHELAQLLGRAAGGAGAVRYIQLHNFLAGHHANVLHAHPYPHAVALGKLVRRQLGIAVHKPCVGKPVPKRP